MSLTLRTAAEQAVHEDTERQLAAGGDPFGDDEPIVAESIDDQAARAAAEVDAANDTTAKVDEPDDADPETPEAKTTTTEATEQAATTTAAADEVQPTAEALAEIAADEVPTPRQVAPQFRVASQEAIDADTAALNAEKAVALKKMMDGDIEPEAYAAIDAQVTQKLGRLLVQSALAEANAQTAAQAEGAATLALMDAAKKSGELDYRADVKAQKQFDTFLNVALEDPDNAGRPYSELLAESHASVLAVRGIAKAAGGTTTDPTPKPTKPEARKPEAAPVTLRGLPNASTPQTGGTVADALGRLKGAEYQAAYAKLTPAQKAAMVDD